jgi:hypothetical protein
MAKSNLSRADMSGRNTKQAGGFKTAPVPSFDAFAAYGPMINTISRDELPPHLGGKCLWVKGGW